jgi:glycosyltransferase involved in cell wall biosynthesis
MTSAHEPERSLNVVIVEFLPSGGMFQFGFQFGQALAQAGHRVHLLTGPQPELKSSTPNFEVVEILPTWHPNVYLGGSSLRRKARRVGRALLLVESWRRTLFYMRKYRPDVVQFGELRYPLDTAAFLAVAKFGRAGAVVDTAHNPLPYDVSSKTQSIEKTGWLTRALLTRAYDACDLVLVLGNGPKADLLGAFPDVEHVVVCGHGDYSSVLASDNVPTPSGAPPHLLFFGAWTKYKNIPLMLDAFALVRTQLPEARLTLAGPVMPDVDENEITSRATTIGSVDLKPGYVAMSDLPELFGSHRAVVFTYATVNISGSVHMAYTFGRPVVVTDVGSMSDAVQDGVTGLISTPDASSIADAMLQILRDPALADRMGREAGQHAREASSWSGVAEKAVAGYLDALQNR